METSEHDNKNKHIQTMVMYV